MNMKRLISVCFMLLSIALLQSQACVTRKDVYECIVKRGDLDHDSQISREEMKYVEDKYISWWVRIPYNIFGGSTQVYNDCDENHDKKISMEEMTTVKTCLETCDKRTKVFNVLQC